MTVYVIKLRSLYDMQDKKNLIQCRLNNDPSLKTLALVSLEWMRVFPGMCRVLGNSRILILIG